ncbi:SusC/RagA family TonB-linked outer membrane protein [Spirosoma oryzicola]|uniref:SusC/RagA family TonB-linked outer membrane protein n=1 Tax=Spirosoma oryzicola TaxID=2898794 RepID=UPI001E4E1118|nr:TonB-dependent receptor [Spirosoma oryzicola]UHG94368.1 TonB-dependent receptor [Spirosoma oryzicola]
MIDSLPNWVLWSLLVGLLPGGLATLSAQPAQSAVTANSQRTITGFITTTTGEALPGVTVRQTGTNQGTVTGADGSFRLILPNGGATLTISFVGYVTQQVPVGTQTSLTIQLREDAQALSEVVVVGYGTQKRSTLTGAVAEVAGRDLVQSPQPNLANSLAGRTPGLIALNRSGEPGRDGSQFFIRGRSTLGDANPLIVIDGVANRLGGLDRLDPNEIESVSVLKDASASIYGAQAANGVILVTSRRGVKGKPQITYSFNQGLSAPTRLPQMADAATYGQILNEIQYYANPAGGLNQRYTPEQIQKFGNGSDPINYPNTNWLRAVLRSAAPQHRHTLGISGGNDDVRYLVSVGNVFQDGIYRNGTAKYNQYSLRANIDANVGKNLTIGVDLNGRQEDRNYPLDSAGRIFRYALRAYPTLVDRYPNGLPGSGTDQGRNPLLQVTDALGYQRDRRGYINSTIRFRENIPFLNGLFVDGFAAIDQVYQANKQWSIPWTTYNYNQTTGQYTPQLNAPSVPGLLQGQTNSTQITLNARLNYDRVLGLHRLGGFLAYEQSTYKTDVFTAYRSDFVSTQIPEFFAGSESDRVSGQPFYSARQNYFGRLQYNYNDRYLVEVQGRYDGSQNFAQARRFGFFPALLLGWRISDEPWFKTPTTAFVNSLKFRASYGLLGNDRIAQYQYLAAYRFDAGYILGDTPIRQPGLTAGSEPNTNVTWEKARTANVALDATLFEGKLSVTFDYFHTSRNDILIRRNVSVPDYTGLVLPNENLGRLTNQGFDFQITHNNTYGPINLSVGTNFTFARNRVQFLDEVAGLPDYQQQTGQSISDPSYGGLLYQSLGIFRNQAEVDAYPHVLGAGPGDIKLEDRNGDGTIDANDRIRPRYSNVPEIVYGVPINLSWRGLDLAILVQGQAHVAQYLLLESGSTGNFFAQDAANRWRPDNPDGTFPRVASEMLNSVNGAYQNTYWLKNAAFTRLKNVQLGYNLPKTLLTKAKIQSLRVYLSGFNLLTIDQLKTIDPEGGSAQGWFYPQQKVYNLGLSARF